MSNGFCFATCDTQSAFRFLQQAHPKMVLQPESFPLLMDLLKHDILRVLDPDFHQPCGIIAGYNYTTNDQPKVEAAVAEYKTAIADAPEREDTENA